MNVQEYNALIGIAHNYYFYKQYKLSITENNKSKIKF